jgi:hypothetical protein
MREPMSPSEYCMYALSFKVKEHIADYCGSVATSFAMRKESQTRRVSMQTCEFMRECMLND